MTILWTDLPFLGFRADSSIGTSAFPSCPPLPPVLPSPGHGEFSLLSCFAFRCQAKLLPSCGGYESLVAFPGHTKCSWEEGEMQKSLLNHSCKCSLGLPSREMQAHTCVYVHIEGTHVVPHLMEGWPSLPGVIRASLAICQEPKGCASI